MQKRVFGQHVEYEYIEIDLNAVEANFQNEYNTTKLRTWNVHKFPGVKQKRLLW